MFTEDEMNDIKTGDLLHIGFHERGDARGIFFTPHRAGIVEEAFTYLVICGTRSWNSFWLSKDVMENLYRMVNNTGYYTRLMAAEKLNSSLEVHRHESGALLTYVAPHPKGTYSHKRTVFIPDDFMGEFGEYLAEILDKPKL